MNHPTERLFLALPFDSREQKEYLHATDSWKQQADFRKWTHPDDMHITLHFLGDTSAGHQSRIRPAIEQAVKSISTFTLCLDKTGWFGQPAHPAVLWLGPQHPPSVLGRLHTLTGQQLNRTIGYKPETRPYSLI